MKALKARREGTLHRKRVTAALGDPSRPLDDAQLKDKADRVFAQAGSTRAGSSLIELGLAGLQDRDSCKALADAMWNTSTSADLFK